jgi:predicted MPP superfamily phosphohydrolase
MNPVLPIVMIVLCAIAGAVAFFYLKRPIQTKTNQISEKQKTAQEFVNVKDIHDNFLYTRDGQIIAYIKIHPISIDLFSDSEKEQISKVLTAELSSVQKPFKFLAVSRPVDITPLVNEYQSLLSETTDQKQKELLRNEIMEISNFATSGEVIERNFFIMLWSRYREGIESDLIKECKEMIQKFESVNISSDIIKEQEIVRLCNLINNPAYTHIENMDI